MVHATLLNFQVACLYIFCDIQVACLYMFRNIQVALIAISFGGMVATNTIYYHYRYFKL